MRGSSASARVLMVEAHKGQLYLLPEHRPAKFQRIDNDGLTRDGLRARRLRMTESRTPACITLLHRASRVTKRVTPSMRIARRSARSVRRREPADGAN